MAILKTSPLLEMSNKHSHTENELHLLAHQNITVGQQEEMLACGIYQFQLPVIPCCDCINMIFYIVHVSRYMKSR